MTNTAIQQHDDPLDLRNVVETIPALVVCALPDGSIEFVNRAWEEYTGYSLQQLSGSGWQTTIHADDLAGFINQWSRVLPAGKPFETEARLRRADGQYRWFLVKKALAVSRTRNGKPSLYTLIGFEDINERKHAEQARQEIEEQWRAAFDSNPTMYFIVDSRGTVVTVNTFGAEQLGYTVGELLDKAALDLFYEPDRQAVKSRVQECFERPGRTVRWEGRKMHKDGTILWVRETGNAVSLKKRPVLLVVCEDITEQKRAEETSEKLRQQLAHLAHLNRVSTVGELTASLAHEIKQPIGAAVTNAEACLRFLDRDQPDVPEAREAALEMIRDTRRAADTIDRVRSLYGKGSSRQEIVDINDVIREMVVMLHNEARQHSVTTRTDLAEGLPEVMADRVQLQQVLMNLILNGIEAMRDTVGELSIRSRLAEDGQLLVSVTDTGVGLPTGRADQVFDAFFTTKSQGTGLGLAITRSIVESHGGRIWATENPGGGATVQFTLPQRRAAHA
jgi:PAS domain S-box-containing protein